MAPVARSSAEDKALSDLLDGRIAGASAGAFAGAFQVARGRV